MEGQVDGAGELDVKLGGKSGHAEGDPLGGGRNAGLVPAASLDLGDKLGFAGEHPEPQALLGLIGQPGARRQGSPSGAGNDAPRQRTEERVEEAGLVHGTDRRCRSIHVLCHFRSSYRKAVIQAVDTSGDSSRAALREFAWCW
jgi:hypothetical protein